MKHIVIVGGGTAGWLTAAYLAAKLGKICAADEASSTAISFTLLESSDIATIGVGEATTPSIRATLADIGFNEFDIMRLCDATFKHGILFKNWAYSAAQHPDDSYFHPFERPLRAGTDGMEQYWLRGVDPQHRSFADAVSIQHQVARAGLSPKSLKDQPFDAALPYAYHLDAGKLATALKTAALQRGVQHRIGTVAKVNITNIPTPRIGSVTLSSGDEIQGDMFIDCSGFSRVLIDPINQALNKSNSQKQQRPGNTENKSSTRQNFVDMSDVLFCDAAVTAQVPLSENETPKPYTLSTACQHGWIWDIGLTSRRGTGYVYSSAHCSAEQAEETLQNYLAGQCSLSNNQRSNNQHSNIQNTSASTIQPRHLSFKVGYLPQQWLSNCVAVGLSSGFLEPLESTGIHLIEQAVWALTSLLPRYFAQTHHAGNKHVGQGAAQSVFNEMMTQHYQHAIHFIKFHYLLTQRTDSEFWQQNTNPASWTPWLREKMASWQHGYPDIYDLQNLHSIFDHASYQYVFFGMHAQPQLSDIGGRRAQFAQQVFGRINDGLNNAAKRLLPHHAILQQIHHMNSNISTPQTNTEQHIKVHSSIRNVPSNYRARI